MGPGQPDLLGGNYALAKVLRAVLSQGILQFYDSMNPIGPLFIFTIYLRLHFDKDQLKQICGLGKLTGTVWRGSATHFANYLSYYHMEFSLTNFSLISLIYLWQIKNAHVLSISSRLWALLCIVPWHCFVWGEYWQPI